MNRPARRAFLHPERDLDGSALRAGRVVNAAHQRDQQLVQRSEIQVDLRLDADHAADPHIRRRIPERNRLSRTRSPPTPLVCPATGARHSADICASSRHSLAVNGMTLGSRAASLGSARTWRFLDSTRGSRR